MSHINKLLKAILLIVIPLTLMACGGGASDSEDSGPDPVPTPAPEPADRFVYSGNSDGTISILKVDPIAGFANPIAFFKVGSQSIRDIIYDQQNERLIILDSSSIHTFSVDEDTGQLSPVDVSSTSVAGLASHITLNSAGTTVYAAVGSGGTNFVEAYTISAAGVLSRDTTTLSVDPDYIQLNPAGDKLYIVSRSDDAIHAYNVAADGSLSTSPLVIATDENPTALLFNSAGTIAYLLRSDNSGDSLEVFDVAANGNFSSRKDFENVGTSAVDMVMSADGLNLYSISSGDKEVYHLTISPANGELTYVDDYDISYTPTDITLSYTGNEMYIGHSEDDVVSTLLINDSDGSLTLKDWARVFDGSNTVASVGNDEGALLATPLYLLAPDQSGLSIYGVAGDGALNLLSKENTSGALIDGEVEVDYFNNIVLATGEDGTSADIITAYSLNETSGEVTETDSEDVTVDSESVFARLELGKSGRYIYALDQDQLSSVPLQRGYVRTYTYDESGEVSSSAIDNELVGPSPENLTIHPAGHYMYAINSFGTASNGDSVELITINATDGTLSAGQDVYPGGRGPGQGRPIDLRFHPNGRYAYVTVEDDNKVVRYIVDENGTLSNISNTSIPDDSGNDSTPHGLAVHPNGQYLYVTEKGSAENIALFSINQGNFSLNFESRLDLSESPQYIEIDPQGRFLYVRYSTEEIELFAINASTGELTSSGNVLDAGTSGGFQATLTLVSPLQ